MTGRAFVWAMVAALSGLGVVLGGCQASPSAPFTSTGPTVGVRNDSDTALRVRFWVGDKGEQHPTPKMRNEREITVVPGGNIRYQLGVTSGFDNAQRSFVRVEIEPVAASFESDQRMWYELNPPSPYTITVKKGKDKALVVERQTGATLTPVPRELWVRKQR